ncbi:MAG TPA: hypothetical protein VK427_05040, partial [Kofleriaceae bacterium]|nr:hypothetical protein [Kofleriaceae bacterium]
MHPHHERWKIATAMRHAHMGLSKIRIAAVLALAACNDPTVDHATEDIVATPLSASTTLAFDSAALALMSPARQALYANLAAASAVPPRLIAELATTATTSISLDVPPLAASPRDSARLFVEKYQALLDDRIDHHEQINIASPEGCGATVIMFDRFVAGMQVIGSRLTLHFDERGHLVFVTNGTAPVPATIKTPNPLHLPGARALASLLPKQIDAKGLRRIKVLAPMPDGSGLHNADLVPWVDERGEYVSALAIGDTAFTGKLAAARDGTPTPTGTVPQAFTAPGESVPSYVSYRNGGGMSVNALPIERNPVERAYRFLEEHATLYRTGEARCQFVPRLVQETEGGVHVRLAQQHGTLPIFGAELVLTFEKGNVASTLGHTIDNLDISATPVRTATQAIADADLALDRG